eukprot:GEZU01026235.1.p1 GENE.GEZU01026235.1~~GEZU01026235.1.p1  ORF type:complete len:105 (+),score=11.32 GEZU01026235.1:65-379(+)
MMKSFTLVSILMGNSATESTLFSSLSSLDLSTPLDVTVSTEISSKLKNELSGTSKAVMPHLRKKNSMLRFSLRSWYVVMKIGPEHRSSWLEAARVGVSSVFLHQ